MARPKCCDTPFVHNKYIEIELTIIFKMAIDLIFAFNSLKFKGQSVWPWIQGPIYNMAKQGCKT